MKIVCSLGTHTQDFTRMAMALDELAARSADEFVVQTGYTHYQFANIKETFDFCPKERMQRLMDETDILVLQGGWGGMCEAVDKGKRVVVVPRINGPEHIHDQGQVVRKMEELGCVIGVYVAADGEELPEDLFVNSKDKLNDYAHRTALLLEKAIERAKVFNFKPLKRGNAKIVADTLEDWFYNKK